MRARGEVAAAAAAAATAAAEFGETAPPDEAASAAEAARELSSGGVPSGVPSGGQHGAHAIFVMDRTGVILLTTDHALNRFHHSSFVAGAPVIAAGEMVVQDGRLISLSNHSGHYAPPPSCLHAVMEELKRLGVADLHRIELGAYSPPGMVVASEEELRLS